MKIVIVSKTRMGNAVCIGALCVDSGRSLRLRPPGYQGFPQNIGFKVGEIWEIELDRAEIDFDPPHIEDVFVSSYRRIGLERNLSQFIEQRLPPLRGDIAGLFNGLIKFTNNGRGYISRVGIPNSSTGFWIPGQQLALTSDQKHYRYGTTFRELVYVGLETPRSVLDAGTLIRVSLARWWRPLDAPESEERCYVQLSGYIE